MAEKLHDQEFAVDRLLHEPRLSLTKRTLRSSTLRTRLAVELQDILKQNHLEVEHSCEELHIVKDKAVLDLEQERVDMERRSQQLSRSTQKLHRPIHAILRLLRLVAAVQVAPGVVGHSPPLSWGVSAGNVHTSARGGQTCQGKTSTMTMPVRR